MGNAKFTDIKRPKDLRYSASLFCYATNNKEILPDEIKNKNIVDDSYD
nr:hypothetical protein [uncultured Methanoregula sp.]